MIDYIALSIGHALIAIALVRLFLWSAVDTDPMIGAMRDQLRHKRIEASSAGRHAKRRARSGQPPAAEQEPAPPRPGNRAKPRAPRTPAGRG